MSYQVCIDIGGTFTDCLVSNERGEISIFKAPTTPGQFERGFIDVLHIAAAGYGLEPAEFLRRIDRSVRRLHRDCRWSAYQLLPHARGHAPRRQCDYD
jgi:Hydantoinase/oxoprolinase N-terminal region